MDASLLRHLGKTLVHTTAASNLALIKEHGLMPAGVLAQQAGIRPDQIALRDTRTPVTGPHGTCTLNHQLPILHAGTAPERMLDAHSRASWAAQLDKRVFFSRAKRGTAFQTSIARDVEIVEIHINTAGLFAAFPEQIDLSPINSGNFRQGGANARRGDWLYVPQTAGLDAFRLNRQARGLIKGRDSVQEVSLRCAIPSAVLANIWVSP